MDRKKAAIHRQSKSEPRSERAPGRGAAPTCLVLGTEFAFSPGVTLRHLSLQSDSSPRSIARDRRGSLFGCRPMNDLV